LLPPLAKPVLKIHMASTAVSPEELSNFNVLCTCHGRPMPSVRWLFKGGNLPVGVDATPEPVVVNEKLTKVGSRLNWASTSTLEQRKNSAGLYTCIGNVKGVEVEKRVVIGAQCKYIFQSPKTDSKQIIAVLVLKIIFSFFTNSC